MPLYLIRSFFPALATRDKVIIDNLRYNNVIQIL
jgi:hypothetical protein